MRRFFTLLLVCMLLMGCNTTKKVTDNSTVNSSSGKDSTVEQTADSTTMASTHTASSLSTEEGSNTTVAEFADGGGSYNASTGEYSGIKKIYIHTTDKKMQEQLDETTRQLSEYKNRYESLYKLFEDEQRRNRLHTQEESSTNWHWWLLAGMTLGVALLIFLKKFPYTKPLFWWL